MRIVVVSHQAAERALLVPLIQSGGYLEIEEVTTAERALTLASEDPEIGVMVSTWELPGISGLELCQAIAAGDVDCPVPVVLISDREDRSRSVDAWEAGAFACLQRPLSSNDLYMAVRAAIRVREANTALVDQSVAEEAREKVDQELALANQELRAAQDVAREATRSKTAFVTNVGHELRTPLNAIIGYSEMLLEEADEAIHSDLIRIRDSGRSLRSMIENVLNLSRMDAGRSELTLEPLEISTLIDDLVDTSQPLIEKTGNALHVECTDDLGVMVTDVSRVRQALWALLSNAFKFTENGEVFLRARRDDERPDLVEFEVADTGIGMSGDQLEHLFDTFFQADMSTTRRHGGTGMGLAIARRFCRLLGGDIRVESQAGVGTNFWILLPSDSRKRSRR